MGITRTPQQRGAFMTDKPTNICPSCEKDLGGHSIYCPKNPAETRTKWKECVCFVHTCWDAKARRKK